VREETMKRFAVLTAMLMLVALAQPALANIG
jgi:hypothetical protein